MAEHEHGTMDVRVHEKTFENFIKFMGRAAMVCIAILIFLAIFNS
ncbi:MAG: aa3-type cytochrome c oxidase subunit IV [Alphaproteobacteria bacterium]|nr:MAG: aa3-type cytochrome c oxidase subunit IV [Alphaproteobacteria bacterium]